MMWKKILQVKHHFNLILNTVYLMSILVGINPCMGWKYALKDTGAKVRQGLFENFKPFDAFDIDEPSLSLLVENFNNEDFNGRYFPSFQDINDLNLAPIFKKDNQCIWWHQQRQWWIGSCEEIGKTGGYSYLCV